MRKPILYNILVDIYLISSVFVLFFFSNEDAYELLFALGAKSWFLCLGLISAGVLNQYVGIIAVLWIFLFPLLFVVFYILSCKNRSVPLCVLITMDTLLSVLWLFFCLLNDNQYALDSAILDATFSAIYTLVLVICSSSTGDGSVC